MADLEQLRAEMAKHFGFQEFLPGQEDALSAILAGRDALVIMPTGGGKSLCYQLPALVLQGVTVVVSPLIALMKDQVDSLTARGIPATAINSSLSDADLDDRLQGLARGAYRLVYIAPERFRSERFLRVLAPLSIALFALDEAHCVSQWGHDFRPDYLRIRAALRELGQPPVVALTATATPDVRADIITQLGLGQDGRGEPQVSVSGFARPNLMLRVTRVGGRDDKLARIAKVIKARGSGIIYCSTRKNVERVTADLRKLGVRALCYHGGLGDAERRTTQDAFMQAERPVVVATNAFGMGINRPDLRFVLHHDLPGSLEAYYQEAGRAGRDGEAAECELLFNFADVRTQEFFIEGANPSATVVRGVYGVVAARAKDESVAMTGESIASRLPEKANDMAVSTALVLLERAGLVARTFDPDSGTSKLSLAGPPRSGRDLPFDFAALEEKHRRDRRRLALMIRYVESRTCRHRFILDYFGDPATPAACTACDRCPGHAAAPAHALSDDEITIVQKALSCVARMNGRFGRGRITQVLTGSAAQEVRAAGLDQLSTYGLLSGLGTTYVGGVLDALVDAGCIEVLEGDYPLLKLTDLGDQVMRRQRALPIALPDRPTRAKPGERAGKAQVTTEDEGAYDDAVYTALKNWRREKAEELGGLPAYLIYADRTLRDLARALPQDLESLVRVRGIGPAKARQFGEDTLLIIRQVTAG